jgi:hypothetical protein
MPFWKTDCALIEDNVQGRLGLLSAGLRRHHPCHYEINANVATGGLAIV